MTLRVRAAWDLYHEKGWSRRRIARELGISPAAVDYRLMVARQECGFKGRGAGQQEGAGRCRCGLLRPCQQCLPSVYEMAARRVA